MVESGLGFSQDGRVMSAADEGGVPASCDSEESGAFVRRVASLAHALGWLLAGVFLLVALLGLSLAIRERLDANGPPDWTASSSAPIQGCLSPRQVCASSPSFFFHTTREANPWVEFDLGRVKHLRAVVLRNRSDCCQDRAKPLVISVSTDYEVFADVKRVERKFSHLTLPLKGVPARWVRIRLEGTNYLHLRSVEFEEDL